MKITHIIAAATMLAGLGVSSAASAQDYRGGYGQRYDSRRDYRDDRRDYRDDRRDYRDDRRDYRDGRYDERGRHYGWDRDRHYGWNSGRGRCRSEWRHHRSVTVCYR